MDNFIVSARKYRPQTFDTVVGQQSITNTLKNAIRSNHLAQAFLFCGPRGVGKTTCARILAKTINCFEIKNSESIEACNTCESCTSFNESHSFNIHELDAASNNSVDDIRQLVDQVRIPPQVGEHAIYIIDEVHMLSTAAFNAFLKTLEEPPAHAIFILATTEKHKIIPTILSRCQIFDFNRIQVDDISTHLAHIAEKENITAEPDALHIIGQKADGALRDALSIFDRIVSFANNNVTYQATIDSLNILDYDYYFRMTDYMLAEDIPNALLLYNQVINNGFDGHNFVNGLAAHFRNLLVCKDPATLELLEVGQNIKEKYGEQAKSCQQSFLLDALSVTNHTDLNYKLSKNQRLHVELCLMQLCSLLNSELKKKKRFNIIPHTLLKSKGIRPIAPSPSIDPPKNKAAEVEKTISPAKVSPMETAQLKTKNTPRKTSGTGISLKSLLKNGLKEKKSAEEATAATGAATDDFTSKQLLDLWDEYAERLKTAQKINLHTTMCNSKPEIKEDYVLYLPLESLSQSQELDKERPELLSFLRTKLNNFSIKIDSPILESSETKMLYTPKDKFEHMAKINPALAELRRLLELDYH